MESDWVLIDRDVLLKSSGTEPKLTKVDGVQINVFVSPYDIPHAVRGQFFEDRNRFVILFRYLGENEPLDREQHHGRFGVRLGKYSNRIYEISVAIDKSEAPEIALRLQAIAKDDLPKLEAEHPNMHHFTQSARFIRDILSSQAEKLVQPA